MDWRTVPIVVLLLCVSFASESESFIVGQVLDSEGAVIAKARVLIHWDPAGSTVGLADNIGIRKDATIIADASGHYSLEVPPGFYDVFVTAMAFTPTAGKVRVKSGQRATYNTQLPPDPLVSKELAH